MKTNSEPASPASEEIAVRVPMILDLDSKTTITASLRTAPRSPIKCSAYCKHKRFTNLHRARLAFAFTLVGVSFGQGKREANINDFMRYLPRYRVRYLYIVTVVRYAFFLCIEAMRQPMGVEDKIKI